MGRTLEDFKTSVTVAAHSKVTFELTYEELLSRRLGKYELLINAQPGQIVKDFKVRERPFSWVTWLLGDKLCAMHYKDITKDVFPPIDILVL